jgi:hypothetical protein
VQTHIITLALAYFARSLDPEWRAPVSKAGAIRYLLPLLQSKIHPARCVCVGGCR